LKTENRGGETVEENNALNWDAPIIPHEYANVLVMGKSVVLVRHFFADTGDVEKIYHDYISEKIAEIDDK